MATLLGTLYGNLSGWPSYPDYFAIDIYLESQNYAALTSSLRFEWYVKRPGSDYTTYKQNAYWVQTTQAGTESEEAVFDITDASPGAWYHYVTTYATIQHTPDGRRTLALDAAIDLTGTSAGTASLSGYQVLPAIPVQAEMYLKSSSSWVKGKVWIKKNGAWVKAKKVYIKQSGTWKEGV